MSLFKNLENPKRPLLGPNVKALEFWGLLLPKKRLMKYFYLSMHLLITIFSATICVHGWFMKSDINMLMDDLKFIMMAATTIYKVTTFLYWQQKWIDIIEYVTNADLAQRSTEDITKSEIINKSTNYCRKITYFYWFLMNMANLTCIIQPIYKYLSSETYRKMFQNGTGPYQEILSSWVPWDKNTITGYLFASVYQCYAVVYGAGWVTSYDTNAMVIMVFFRTELELLRIDCANIFGTEKSPVSDIEAKERLKSCHRRHIKLVKFSEMFDSCLSPILLFYIVVCSAMLCVTAYQIKIETSAMGIFVTTEYLIFGVAQLFIYCWHSNNVLYASDDLRWGPFESTWWIQSVSHQKNLLILTAQFNKSVVFSAGPFTKLTVATFISILKGAYSYYTLLSQSQMK